jgi:hypothetical protein
VNLSFDPLEDKLFAEELRKLDRPVSVKSVGLTNQLIARRRRNRLNQVTLAISIPLGLVTFGLVAKWIMTNPTMVPVTESIVQRSVREPDEVEGSVKDSGMEIFAAAMKHRALLAAKKTALVEGQREIELLRQIKSQQDWALSREVVSRTEISQTISAYKF